MRRFPAISGVLLMLAANAGGAQPKRVAKQPPAATKAQPTLAEADTLDPVMASVDHSRFDALLRAHVVNGLVDYAAFKNNPEFAQYLASLNGVNISKFEEPERIAFWLNVYNAYTIQLIASHGETKSIRNIDKTLGLFSLKGPWSEPFVKAAGRTLTLDDVEHRILRKEFSEPRVHFAMAFGAKGGPPLRSEAYSGAKLDDQLEDQARVFLLKSPEKNRVDTSGKVARFGAVYASPILMRYRTDFGDSPSALGQFLSEYYPAGSKERQILRPRAIRSIDVAVTPPATPPQQAAPSAAVPGTAPPKPTGEAPTVVTTAAPQSNNVKASNDRTRTYFVLIETPFDWSLNIQPSKP